MLLRLNVLVIVLRALVTGTYAVGMGVQLPFLCIKRICSMHLQPPPKENTMSTTITVNAIDLLKADHREAEALFKQYEKAKKAGKTSEKRDIARKVCAALLIHMEIEENIFYPSARKATGDDDKLNEAEVEHAGAKSLITQLDKMEADDPMFDAKIKVLSEQIEHHVEEEEKELFPEVKKSKADLDDIGEQLEKAKARLKAARGID
ncbi:hemerythrin domain-containing protein [Undibacterium sp. TJN25]|uniref:hemerythrin domain-containing protein n=1 Tax=Undibacterium sp. TJN25 TaxID=3413056 RepID=UPI003BEF9829